MVVIPRTKGGDTLRVRVSTDAREAAERARKHGPFSLERYTDAVKAACLAGNVQVFKPGRPGDTPLGRDVGHRRGRGPGGCNRGDGQGLACSW